MGTPVANRTQVEIEGLIGFFVNTMVLRTKVEAGRGVEELLKGVREMMLGAYVNQEVPFEKLVEELQPERDLGRTPLFQVMFVLQNAPEEELDLGELKLTAVEAGVGDSEVRFAVGDERKGKEDCRESWNIERICMRRGAWRGWCSTGSEC